MEPKFDLYVWACENGHYFAMSSTGWLLPGSMAPPATPKSYTKHFHEGQMCPFCETPPSKGQSGKPQKIRRVLYKVARMERVYDVDEETQDVARKEQRKTMRAVRSSSKLRDSQYEAQREEVLETSYEET